MEVVVRADVVSAVVLWDVDVVREEDDDVEADCELLEEAFASSVELLLLPEIWPWVTVVVSGLFASYADVVVLVDLDVFAEVDASV